LEKYDTGFNIWMYNYGFCYEVYVNMTVFVAWFDFCIFSCMQGWIQLVSLRGGAISIIFGSHVSVGSQVSFWIVQNHGEKCYFRKL